MLVRALVFRNMTKQKEKDKEKEKRRRKRRRKRKNVETIINYERRNCRGAYLRLKATLDE